MAFSQVTIYFHIMIVYRFETNKERFGPEGFDQIRIPFDPCNSIKRFDLCPFVKTNSTYLQPPYISVFTLLARVECKPAQYLRDSRCDSTCGGKHDRVKEAVFNFDYFGYSLLVNL